MTKLDDGTLTIDADAILDMEANNLTLRGPVVIYGEIIITGNLIIGINAVVTVASGGSISAGYIETGGNGSLDIQSGAVVTATAFLNDFAGPATNSVNIDGTLTVSPGGFTNNGDGEISGNGTFNADVTDNGTSNFSGTYNGTCTGNCPLVLPVKLVDFSAQQNNDEVELAWSTATELNNDFFSVERSQNGRDFIVIGALAGGGTTNKISNYSFLDPTPLSGTSYYRLKQTDYDGQYEYFDAKSITFDHAFGENFSVYPNPVFETVIVAGYRDDISNIKLMNLNGKVITNLVEIKVEDDRILINIRNMASGIYILQIGMESHKIIKE
ncbi:MAG: T9SS type A sorting domain-containing protein [Cytophagales bacterium]|nr:T9SS type A sorting domain-containing protein [Cytophagales bacterium]